MTTLDMTKTSTRLDKGDGAGDALGVLDGVQSLWLFTHLGEGDGAGDALGALNGGALPQLPLLQGLLVDGVQQRGGSHPAVLAQQRLQKQSLSFRGCVYRIEAVPARRTCCRWSRWLTVIMKC